jgi:hypothetical protein
LLQQMPQPIVLGQRLVALGDRGVSFRQHHRKPRLQYFDIGRKLICALAHARHRIRFARRCDVQSAA